MLNIPDGLPTLAAGKHEPGDGRACVMEYVSILAGEKFSDSPSCTHPDLATVARQLNDTLPDEERHLLVPLIGRLFGTSKNSKEIQAAIYSTSFMTCGCRTCIDGRYGGNVEALITRFENMIDAYDKAAGRTEVRELSTDELRELSDAVTLAS